MAVTAAMANLKKRGNKYSVQWRWEGKQYIKPLYLEDKAEAERVRLKVEEAIAGLKRGRYPKASRLLEDGYNIRDIIFPNEKTAHLLEGEATADDGNPLTVSQLRDDYVEYLQGSVTDGHYRRAKSKLNHIVKIHDRTRVTAVSRQMLDIYVRDRKKQKAKPETIKGEMSTIRAMFNWAHETNHIEKCPIENFPTIRTNEADPFLFKDDVEKTMSKSNLNKAEMRELGKRMVLAPKDIDKLVQLAKKDFPNLVLPIMLVSVTGMRRSELTNLARADFDASSEKLTIRSGKGSKKKKRTTRIVHVHETVLPILTEHDKSLSRRNKWLFPVFDPTKNKSATRPIEDRRADRAGLLLSQLIKDSEFDLLGGWHALRHSFVTICVWKGMTFEQIAQWTGQIDRETQKRYTHHSGEESKALMSTLPFKFEAGKNVP
jgi:integrase